MADETYQDYLTGGDIVPASFSMENLPSVEQYSPLPELSWREFGAWLLRRRSRYRVEGNSMLPGFQPGDEVLYQPQSVKHPTLLQVGEVVIARHPAQAELVMIKRIGAIDRGAAPGGDEVDRSVCHDSSRDRYFLLGDNRAASTDSRNFGWVGRSQLMGRVTCRFA